MKIKLKNLSSAGFTVIEILIVVIVIGMLIGLALNAAASTQKKARITAAETELDSIKKAVFTLGVDTEKWPNGCQLNAPSDLVVNIGETESGLVQTPSTGTTATDCEWNTVDVSNWNGPYIAAEKTVDPWGGSYAIDLEYLPWSNCSTITDEPSASVAVSYGPDEAEETCDDVYRKISD